ncbi:ral GTPase-activating protein subunit beta-like isoform X3 [Amphibalanus amphitrite]|uniref:ral GTPase-activating protein subunit beta-like isoform X3 n=1 Tax=Amphibalanus amphitrite TaxID=1232801 RepID=UPI001C91B021|nr:ral GTPase-activating protein subunit beta-like isoform X3 [Amphibalanus amphitrite]XP_043236476.1 ral GTPase-activating protein subunit beta-like isoform X3 [Amphibalanus amphitrite]
MYQDWVSLSIAVHDREAETRSVLSRLPAPAGQTVVAAVVRGIASTLGIASAPQPSPLSAAAEVDWCMEVICHGLSLPLSEHDTIRDCVNIYCEWLTALLPAPKLCVPDAVQQRPNHYSRRMLNHLQNLFVPRSDQSIDTINRQAVLCHRVLRTVQSLSNEPARLEPDTWSTLLLFLLTVNDSLLSPPTVKDDIGDQMYERVLGVLFEVWIQACCKCFPPPPLWKTFRESCLHWRHRPGLVDQWSAVMTALTARLLESMYGPGFPALAVSEEDAVPASMAPEAVAQTWYRMLHTIGNPVEISSAAAVSSTQQFLQYAISSEAVIEPHQHPCLSQLPAIFHRAVRAISLLVNAFLGVTEPPLNESTSSSGPPVRKESSVLSPSPGSGSGVTPPAQRRHTRSMGSGSAGKGSRASIIGGLGSRTASASSQSGPAPSQSTAGGVGGSSEHPAPPPPPSVTQPLQAHSPAAAAAAAPAPAAAAAAAAVSSAAAAAAGGSADSGAVSLAPGRAKCNSVLHLFGAWLFEAALVGTSAHSSAKHTQGQSKRASAAYLDSRKSSTSSQTPEPADLPATVTADKFERGRAEALGALCRIFCAKKTSEEILPSYLASFYLVLHEVLSDREGTEVSQNLAAILLNCSSLLQLDLDGVNCLLPALTDAVHHVIASPRPITVRDSDVSGAALRRASVRLLVSMLALPLHFQGLPVREPVPGDRPPVSFLQLRPRLVGLLVTGLQQEADPVNCQMMLGGLLMCVQDSALYEESCHGLHDISTAAAAAGSQHVTSDSARGLYVRAIYLVCHRLMTSWKAELNTSLAALELLAGLARVRLQHQDVVECKRAVKWLCDYICHQCSRPPPAHSKDLHSTIVAAFRCVSVWLLEHPYLLDDRDTLATLLEVVELGISGTKSQAKYGEPPVMKHDKQLKPASMRVKEAAEALLYVLMEQVDYFPCASGVWSLSSHLTEASLLHHCHPGGGPQHRKAALAQFKYFVTESLLIALLEQPLGNDEDPQPTVTCLMRGPSLRTAWMLQLRHLPRHKSGARLTSTSNPGRPLPMSEPATRHNITPAFFPDAVDRIPSCKADRSIPTLESLIQDQKSASEHNQMLHLMEQQMSRESVARRAVASRTASAGLNMDTECVPPPPSQEFQTARLFLSHFQLLDDWPTAGQDKQQQPSFRPGHQLVALDAQAPGFAADLDALDATTFRTCDTVHVYYVRSGQTNAASVLANGASLSSLDGPFSEFLLSLGWPVDVSIHPGWTGRPETSFNTAQHDSAGRSDRAPPDPPSYDGSRWALYWADALTEVAFVVPSSSVGPAAGPAAAPEAERKRRGGPEPPVLVVWLESFDDHLTFPSAELAGDASNANYIIFIHALQNKLYRIHLQGPSGKMTFASPLVEGLVVSRRSLGHLVRQTAINVCTRRRLENENSHPPHVRRKQKIQEMLMKYQMNMSQPEFYTMLFSADGSQC